MFVSDYTWDDGELDDRRAALNPVFEPMSTYEVHLGSWRPGLSYRELAEQLTDYVLAQGFTHVELLPVAEHPVRRLVGLPGHLLLRADIAIRHAGRLPVPGGSTCTRPASA